MSVNKRLVETLSSETVSSEGRIGGTKLVVTFHTGPIPGRALRGDLRAYDNSPFGGGRALVEPVNVNDHLSLTSSPS